MDTDSTSDSEEEIYVYAEFEDNVDIDQYKNVHVLGIDTKQPIIQLDDTFFLGKFENPLGTYMVFGDDPSPKCMDPLFDKLPEKNLKYLFKTRKLMKLQHAYITPKVKAEEKCSEQTKPQDNDIQLVKFKNIQEALEVFKNEWSTSPSSSTT